MFTKLGKVPSRCLSLRQLNMSATEVASREIRTLFSFGISVSWLSLKGCKQVDNKVIARIAKYCPALSYIDLDGCTEVTDEALIDLFSSCKFLQTLLLPGVFRISDSTFTGSAERGGLQFLREVNLSGCRKLSDAAVFVLTSRCSAHLQSLNLSGLNNVTSNSISVLVQKCRNLVNLNLFGVSVSEDIVPSVLLNQTISKKRIGTSLDERLPLSSSASSLTGSGSSPLSHRDPRDSGGGSTSPRGLDSSSHIHATSSAPVLNTSSSSSSARSSRPSSRHPSNSSPHPF
jgi:hypothetical protein